MSGKKQYNLRERHHDTSKDSDEWSPNSKTKGKNSSYYSPNRSGYSTSHSYREQGSGSEDTDNSFNTESLTEDEANLSYPSTTCSPSARTPSPEKHVKHRRGIHDSSKLGSRSPPSGKKMYPDLSDMSDARTPSPRSVRMEGRGPRQKPPVQGKKKPTVEGLDMKMLSAVVVIGVIVLFLLFGGSSEKKQGRTNEFQTFVTKVDHLQTIFKSQEKRTWRSIKSSVKHILNGTNPEYPAVVMFATQKQNAGIGACLARRVASLFNAMTTNTHEDGYFDARLFSHLESAKQKEYLDEKINSNFKWGRSVVIDHLEALSPSASLLLHGTCDNDNAPFKNVFIGIVFYVENVLRVHEVDAELTKYFSKELDMDKIGALLTRINNNAVVVVNESNLDSNIC